jgi:hypothetical protein
MKISTAKAGAGCFGKGMRFLNLGDLGAPTAEPLVPAVHGFFSDWG